MDDAARGEPPEASGGRRTTRVWPYLGVGCFTAVAGFSGGGMIAVLIAKIVGAATRCAPDAETGPPCNWFTYCGLRAR